MTAQTPATPEISLVEAVWRFRLMSLIIVLVSVVASVAVTQLMFSSVQATARFAVTDPTNNNNVLRMGVVSGQGYATYTAQRAAFAGSTPVLARAAAIVKEKGGPAMSGEGLRGRVQTSSKPDGGVVIVTATGGDMREAALAANAVVQAYQEVTVSTNVDRLDKQLANLQEAQKKITDQMELTTAGTRAYRLLTTNLAKLQSQESGVLSARANANDGVQFVDTADPTAKVASQAPRNGVIGLAIGLIVACVVAFLRAAAPGRRQGAPAAVHAGPGLPPGGGGLDELPPGPHGDLDPRLEVEPPVARAELPRPASPPRRARSGERSRPAERGGRGTRRAGRDTPPDAGSDRPDRLDSADRGGLQGTWAEEGPPVAGAASPAVPPSVPSPPSAPSPSSTESLLDRAESLLDRTEANGSRPSRAAGKSAPGRPVAGNGAAPRSGTAPRGSRAKGGSHAKGPQDHERPKKDLPVELWGEDLGGDPTRTAEDKLITNGKDAASILKDVSKEAEKGKKDGSSSLMRYDLDR
ncbi:hypothetical protein GCM10023085_29040 [Actinomadura viridis]|uniref:Capsular polysaccharide biosynthesis protein n=1 Tax=Actinomadura viridis TaxID=58110 RepID=A0A931GH77_9ACTN|nr:hypothetical protein [Actinomadura viridis]MBG6087110.1 capsular polysaccharide biosynthesis protein [Actinomadura viridis]